MPHNKTRLWVGMAIAAITIPAVGTFYNYSAATSNLVGNPISAAGRIDLASSQQGSFGSGQIALKEPLRDYQAEVNAALARQGAYPGQRLQDDEAYDETFDDDPLDVDTNGYGNVSTSDVPNPSNNPDVIAYSTDGPVTTDSSSANGGVPQTDLSNEGQSASGDQTTDNGAMSTATADAQNGNASTADPLDDYGYGQGGTMSDSDVYRLVITNLSPERRDDFVQAYGAMSDQQRASVIDSFRQQIQGGQ